MNLHDVVPLQKLKTTKRPAGMAELIASQKPLIDAAETIKSALSLDNDVHKVVGRLYVEVADKSNKFLSDFFRRNDVLPEVSLMTSVTDSYSGRTRLEERSATQIMGSHLTRLAQSPRARLSDLRSLADSLALAVFPVEYLNPKSFQGAYRVESQVNAFRTAADKQDMDVYVMAPIRHYDVLRQIRSEDPGGQMYSKHHATTFESLQMTMPALVMMSDAIGRIGTDLQTIFKHMDSLDASVKSTIRGLELMDKRMNDLSKRVDQQQEQQLREQIRIKQLEEDLVRAELAARANTRSLDWFAVGDPMVFAVPKGTSLDAGEALAIVGPCWGPEFDELIPKALGMQVVPDQRSKLENTCYRLW